MDWFYFLGLWGSIGMLVLLWIANRWKHDQCGFLFKVFWTVVAGPLAWIFFCLLFIYELIDDFAKSKI